MIDLISRIKASAYDKKILSFAEMEMSSLW